MQRNVESIAAVYASIQSAHRGTILSLQKQITHPEVTFTLWDFCMGKFNMADETAGRFESKLCVYRASTKAFDRTGRDRRGIEV